MIWSKDKQDRAEKCWNNVENGIKGIEIKNRKKMEDWKNEIIKNKKKELIK